MHGTTELVQKPKESVTINPIVSFERSGQFWHTWKVRFNGEELATVYVKPEIKFDSKALAKLFSTEKELEDI